MNFPHAIWIVFIMLATSVASAAEVFASPNTLGNTPHIRTLAASCAACHGTQGNSIGITPTLAGLDGNYFVTQILAFKDGTRASTVMQRHAKGLNLDEINLLAQYFSQQKRVTSQTAKTQSLKPGHEN